MPRVTRPRGGGRPPKNGLWFELAIASLLKTVPQKFGERTLDLRSFEFDINPPTPVTPSRHFGKSPDIIAASGDLRYYVSCKFSSSEDSIIQLGSQVLRDVFEEYGTAFKFSNASGFRAEFILATNMRFAKGVQQLLIHPDLKSVRTVFSGSKRLGQHHLNNVAMVDLARRIIPLQVTVRELESYVESNQVFATEFDNFSKRLVRIPRVGLNLASSIRPSFVFNCSLNGSTRHRECTDVMIDDSVCHIGKLGHIRRTLASIATDLKRSPRPFVTLVPKVVFGKNTNLFEGSSVPETRLCSLMSSVLNNRILIALPIRIGVYMVPGSRHLVLLDGTKLAPKLKETLDNESCYHPGMIPEFRRLRLGTIAMRDITKLALSVGIGLSVSDSAIRV